MNYTLYQDNGRIVSTLSCRKEDLALNVTAGLSVLEATVNNPSDYYVAGGKLVAKPSKPSQWHDFDYTTKQWVNNTNKAWSDIRSLRDLRLSQSDWRVTKAVETGEPMPTGWAAYRQALRDITQQSDPLTLLWPVEPS